jgi:NAD(P)-dependent dehydrogenase (short-subunit alcohol dehydrogenase family)
VINETALLRGKVVAVAGVGPGLGSEIARAVVRDEGRVVLGARNADRLEGVAAEVDASGTQVLSHALDITSPDSCDAWFATAVERFGGLDAVVNVAALDFLPGSLMDAEVDSWLNGFRVNVEGSVHLYRAAVPHLRANGGGSIVMIGSQSAILPPDSLPMAPYGASKAALQSLQRYMAIELGPDRIRVNTVVPTWMWGPPVQIYVAWQAQERGVSEDEIIAELKGRFPLGEIPADEDVADVVSFFCSDRSRMITGQSLLVNAGELMP